MKKKKSEWIALVDFKVHGSVQDTPLGGWVVKHSLADPLKATVPNFHSMNIDCCSKNRRRPSLYDVTTVKHAIRHLLFIHNSILNLPSIEIA